MNDLVVNTSEKSVGTGFRKFLSKLTSMFRGRRKSAVQTPKDAISSTTINLAPIPTTSVIEKVQDAVHSSNKDAVTTAQVALEAPPAAKREDSPLDSQKTSVPQSSTKPPPSELQSVHVEVAEKQMLTESLLSALKMGKEDHLQCHQLLIPSKLLAKVTEEVLKTARDEPSGLRGCIIYLYYQKKSSVRRWSRHGDEKVPKCEQIAEIVCDPATVATFELSLVLKPENKLWRLPGWLKRGVSLSYNFKLTKKKLYRTYSSSSFADSLREE